MKEERRAIRVMKRELEREERRRKKRTQKKRTEDKNI